MKLATVENNITTNVESKGAFKITASAKAFKILSSGLYTDKILAVVRELSTNAFDANAAAGKHKSQFEIHMPTVSEPWFSVEDFGCGMNESDVDDVYTTYFGSTKAETNNEAGFMGLGSKSPFSYTDSFTVQTIKDGVKCIYTMATNAAGEPVPHLMIRQETDQANGTKVSVPVDKYDISKFITAAKKTFRTFDIKPVVYGVEDTAIAAITKEQEYLVKNEVYGIRKSHTDDWFGTNDMFAIQGPVAYPLGSQFRQTLGTEAATQLRDFAFSGCHLDVFFPIGQLDPTASRETLSHDPITNANIMKRLQEVSSRIVKDLQEYIDAAPSLFEAYLRAAEIKDIGVIDTKSMRPTYKGELIKSWGKYYEFEDGHYAMSGFKFVYAQLKPTRKTMKLSSYALPVTSLPIETVQYFFNDIGKKGDGLYRKHVKEKSIKTSYFVTFADEYIDIVGSDARECMKWLQDQISGMNFTLLSSIPVVKKARVMKPRATGLAVTKTWKYLNCDSTTYRGKLTPKQITEQDVITQFATQPRVYMHQSELGGLISSSIMKMVSHECQLSNLPNNVYVLTKPEYNTAMKSNIVWIHVVDFMRMLVTDQTIENIQTANAIIANNEVLDRIHYSSSTRENSVLLKSLGIDGKEMSYSLTTLEGRIMGNKGALRIILGDDRHAQLSVHSPKIAPINIKAYEDFCEMAPCKYPLLKLFNMRSVLGTPGEVDVMNYINLIDNQEASTND